MTRVNARPAAGTPRHGVARPAADTPRPGIARPAAGPPRHGVARPAADTPRPGIARPAAGPPRPGVGNPAADPPSHGVARPAIGVLALFGLMVAPTATAQPNFVTATAAYTVDVLHNATGGREQGSGAVHNVDLNLDFDLQRWPGLNGGVISAHLLWNDDTEFSGRYVGDSQIVSNIEAAQALRLYELWYERNLVAATSLRFGLYDLNTEFDVIETAGLFLNGSHGIGVDYGQTGERGPSIFPLTSLAARLQWQIGERSRLRYAILDAVPGDPDDFSATRVELGDGEGWLHALEFSSSLRNGARLVAGGFAYTADFATIDPNGAGTARADGNAGFYVSADAPVYADDRRDIAAFVRLGRANEELNPFEYYVGAGIVLTGFLPGRPADQIGLAVASARTGRDFRRAADARAHETSIELTWSTQVTDWLRIQPDLQYIVNPGADPALANALVVGVRLEAATQLFAR